MFGQQPKNPGSYRYAIVLAIISILLATMSFAEGSGWMVSHLPLEETITGISFPTTKIGYLSTSGGKVGISRDNGVSWDAYQITGAPPLEDVFFRTADTGLAVGRSGAIYRTVDGGQNWEDRSLKDTSLWLTSCVFLTDSIALVAGFVPQDPQPGVLYRSTDGGKRWDSVAVMGTGFGELFYTKGVPVCFQSYGKLHYSQDRGKTWQTLETVNGRPGRATAISGNTGIICGSSAMLAISSDRGATWQLMKVDYATNFTSVVLLDEKTAYLAGTRGILLYTQDGGKTWSRDEEMARAVDLADITIAGNTIFAVGAGGYIYHKQIK